MIRGSWLLLLAALGPASACGAEPNGRALELLDFRQNELASVGLNEELLFYFSDSLERGSVTSESVRVLGPQGRVVAGQRVVRANALSFLPDLPCASDLSDGGLRPGESYRVILGGFPRPDGLRSVSGAVLSASLLLSFETAKPGGTSPLFLDPFLGPFPLIPRGKRAKTIELEDGILVLECAEALDPASVPAARFELSYFPAGANEPEAIPLAAHLVVNLRRHSELLLEPVGDAFADRRLAPDKYFLQMTGRELSTLGGRAVEPGWPSSTLPLVVPRARVDIDFDEPRKRSSEPPPGCASTAMWGALESPRVVERGLHVRYPAAAGSGAAGALELRERPTSADIQATQLTIPAEAHVDLSASSGPLVLRAQTVLEVRGRLTRSGAGAKRDPLTHDLERAAELGEEHWEPLSDWVQRLLDPDQSWAHEPWTVLIAGGDIRVPAGGAVDVDGPLVLVAGGSIRVGGEVLSQSDLWRTPEGGGVVASHTRLARLPLVLDPPELNPLRVPLVVGLLTQPFPWTPRASGWRAVLVGQEGSGRLSTAFLQRSFGSGPERMTLDPSALGPGPVRTLVKLEILPSPGELWNPPRLERLSLEALPARFPAEAQR